MPRTKRSYAESDGECEDAPPDAVDDDGHDDDDHDGRHAKKAKKKKVRIMTESGQSECDRRVLRRKQRELHQDIVIGGSGSGEHSDVDECRGSIEDPESKEFERIRGRNNALWNDVRYTREAVLDSENIDIITSKAARQVERMIQVPRYDANRLAQKLVAKCSSRTAAGFAHFGWHDLGFQVGVCFNALPSRVSFLRGPIDATYRPKERKNPERRKKFADSDENAEEERPEEVDQTKKKELDGNALSAVEEHIAVISKTLRHRSLEEKKSARAREPEFINRISQELDDDRARGKKETAFHRQMGRVDAVKYFFNPNSFTQTVENIFHYSFLVKKNVAGIGVRTLEEAEELGGAGPGPVVYAIDKKDPSTVNMPAPKQAIVSLNMKDWKDMCKAYAVEESDVPHRKMPKK